MRIFVKTTNAILPNGLPALVENISASRISGEKAKEVLENIEKILAGENEFFITKWNFVKRKFDRRFISSKPNE